MTSRRCLIPAAVATAAALAPAAFAQVPPPTIAFDRPCYTAEQALAFTGSGYTPSGPVQLLFSVPGEARASFPRAPPTRRAVSPGGSASKRTRCSPRTRTAATSRSRPPTRRAPTPARRRGPPVRHCAAHVHPLGRLSPAATCRGARWRSRPTAGRSPPAKPLYFHFQKGRTTVAAVRAGVLSANCGDLVARIRVPKKLNPGAYRLVLSTESARRRASTRGARVASSSGRRLPPRPPARWPTADGAAARRLSATSPGGGQIGSRAPLAQRHCQAPAPCRAGSCGPPSRVRARPAPAPSRSRAREENASAIRPPVRLVGAAGAAASTARAASAGATRTSRGPCRCRGCRCRRPGARGGSASRACCCVAGVKPNCRTTMPGQAERRRAAA